VSEATKDQIKGAFGTVKEYEPGIRRGTVHASSRSWRSLDQDSSSWWATTTPAASRRTPRPVRTSATRCSGRCPVDTGPDREPRDGGTSRCRDRHRSRRLIRERVGRRWGNVSIGSILLLNFLIIITSSSASRCRWSTSACRPSCPCDRRGGLFGVTATGSFQRWERFMMLFVAVNVVMIPLVLHAHVATHSLFRDLAVRAFGAARPRRACCSSSRSSARPSRRGSCTSSRATSSTRRFRHVG